MATLFIWFAVSLPSADAEEVQGGTLFDVGGHRLHIECEGAGSPVVILDHGLGGSSRDWRKVQPAVTVFTRACIYDRAGYGMSDPGPPPRTSSRIASELRTLLERAGVPPPYILAGHSFGGYNMRIFASLFSQETEGLVLVDTPNERQVDGFFQTEIMRQIDPQGLLQGIWRSETLSVLSAVDLESIAPLLGFKAKTLRAIMGEMAAFKESGAELQAATASPELPLIVIMHGRRVLPPGGLGDQMEQEWLKLQRDLAAHYKKSDFIVAKTSAHNIPLDQPELVVAAIRRLVETQQRGTR